MHKIINGNQIEMTTDEATALEKDRVDTTAEIKVFEDKQIKKVADQKTGNKQLLDLGLTQDEATALTGYTPPVEE